MNSKALTVKGLLLCVGTSAACISSIFLVLLYRLTGSAAATLLGLGFAFIMVGLVGIVLFAFRRKLAVFTKSLCHTIDLMMSDAAQIPRSYEQETLLSRVEYRLDRLFSQMQDSRQALYMERQALQAMVSDISHQVKTPISNMKLMCEALQAPALPPARHEEFLQNMAGQLDKLDFLMQAMVKMGRLETGVLAIVPENAPVYETVAAALGGIYLAAEHKRLQVAVDCDPCLRLCHDTKWTTEALFNVLDNAVKYTEQGGSIQVSVTLGELYLKIAVKDTGHGIPEKEHAAIFQRFFRGREVSHIEGVGVGLFLTRKIITLQGGYVMVDSDAGKGSVFSLYLPVKRSVPGGPR